jgi:hypothetical protein
MWTCSLELTDPNFDRTTVYCDYKFLVVHSALLVQQSFSSIDATAHLQCTSYIS